MIEAPFHRWCGKRSLTHGDSESDTVSAADRRGMNRKNSESSVVVLLWGVARRFSLSELFSAIEYEW